MSLPWQFLAVVLLAGAGVWLLLGLPWALITAAGLLLLDLMTELLPTERAREHGRTDRSAGT